MKAKTSARILNPFFLCLLLMAMFSCNRKEDDVVKRIPVDYFLSDSQKAIIKSFEQDTVTFVNELNNKTITFISKEAHVFLDRTESENRRGEALSLSFKSDTDYLPNFSFFYWLVVLKDGSCMLDVTFATGTFWSERANDYETSNFAMVPFAESKDSLPSGEDWFIYDFKDSLSIGGTVYKDMYHLTSTWHYYYPVVVADCYYQKDKGVVAFTDKRNIQWILASKQK